MGAGGGGQACVPAGEHCGSAVLYGTSVMAGAFPPDDAGLAGVAGAFFPAARMRGGAYCGASPSYHGAEGIGEAGLQTDGDVYGQGWDALPNDMYAGGALSRDLSRLYRTGVCR